MRKILKYGAITLLVLVVAGIIYVAIAVHVIPPQPKDLSSLKLERQQLDSTCYTIGNNWIRKSKTGLWEMYVEGKPFERGVINGKLAKELVQKQEEAFTGQIAKMIPSRFYRNFLKYFIGVFNRHLEENLTEEEKLEIYGVSKAASPEFDYIGTPFQRIMNYHAAHDIGHALQNLALVGCSSFSTWNARSQDSLLITGRNFDFYVGDKFAEDKMVMFCKPDKGYKFMIITWGGFTGVVSGMNMEGLSITLNAAKSEIPTGSATPVSLIARDILQYAKNIDEAVKIARSRKSFISESFLISSAADNKTVILEKTPTTLGIVYPQNDQIVCTNHYQSKELVNTEINKEQMAKSASVYRQQRIEELLSETPKNTPVLTASILRNQLGLHDRFIGMGNEKAVNQLICHHAVIFEPQKRIVWVSTSNWQLGEFAAYDLNKIFAMNGLKDDHEINDTALTIPADSFLQTPSFHAFQKFRKLKLALLDGKDINVEELVQSNPEFYDAYVLAGNYCFKRELYAKAKKYYAAALTKEMATKYEESHIHKQIRLCDEKMKK